MMMALSLPVGCVATTVCLLLVSVVSVQTDDVNVTVPEFGVITGKTEDITFPDGNTSTVAIFRGIPYAEPPLGVLRFAKPVPLVNVTTPFPALNFGPDCPQRAPKHQQSEDCLYLNVYVPLSQLNHLDNNTVPLAVFVWIHGGAFQSGSGRADLGKLTVYGNIISVTINYRVGALGFLTTGDQEAPGNFGLWDQRLALQWVKASIRAFGGDPERITIGGGSAGSFSVTFQALHPGNIGLFQRLIAESGTAISVMNNRDNAANYTKLLAKHFDCDLTSSKTMMSCLRQQNASDIATTDILPLGPFELPWAPAFDNDFFTQNPSDQVAWPPSHANLSGLQSTDAIFATASAEGIVSYSIWVTLIAKQLGEDANNGVSKRVFDRVIQDMLTSQKQTPDQQVMNAIDYEYRDWTDPDNVKTLRQSAVDLLTDQQWFVPNVIFSRNHALNNSLTNTYLLQFDQTSTSMGWLKGAPHVAYKKYVWGASGTDKEWALSKVFMTHWSNFIKTGDPNKPMTTTTPWPKFDVDNESYLLVVDNLVSVDKHCKARRTDFWLDYLPGVQAASGRHPGNVNPGTNKPDCPTSGGLRPMTDGAKLLSVGWLVWMLLML